MRMMRTGIVFLLMGLLWPAAVTAKLPDESTISDFKKARQLVDEDPAEAWKITEKLPDLGVADDVRLALVAETALRTQRTDVALDTLERLAKVTDDDNEKYRANLERAELLALLGKLDAAEKLLDQLREDDDDIDGRSNDRRFFQSRVERLDHDIAQARGQKKRARSKARNLLLFYPTELATRRAGLERSPENLSTRDRHIRAKNLMNSWGYEDARVEFEKLAKTKRYKDSARWDLGIIGLRKLRDRAKEAEDIFRTLIKEDYREEDAHWYLARALMKQERYDDALGVFDDIKRKFPRSKYIDEVYYYRGWLPYDHRENDKAIAGFKAYIDKYGRRARKSSYIYGFLAWAYMRESRWEEAIDTWDEMMPFGNMMVAGKAMFWKAHAQNELGRTKKAIETLDALRGRYPLTYYGFHGEQLRARIEGKDPRASQVWWPEGGGKLDDSPKIDVLKKTFSKLDKDERLRWERVKVLALLGERHLARKELDPIEDDLLEEIDDDERNEWVHALGRFIGNYNDMWKRITGGSISRPAGLLDPEALETAMAYPRAYRDVVEDVTGEFEIPPELVWSIMRQESRYKPSAVSYTDAVGALQMIPKTARLVARDLGTTYDIRTFFRPEVGFRFSGYYMEKLLEIFDGLFIPMAASYNSGPHVVKRWFERNPEASFAWLIEEFEYNEGRNYCRKVSEHMLRYLYYYEPDEERRKAILDRMFPLSRDIEFPEDVGY